MGKQIDWTALDIVCELLGITDLERLLAQLVAIRDKDRKPE